MTEKSNEKQGTSGVPLNEIVMTDLLQFKPVVYTVGDFTFCQDGTTAKLDIKEDITPLESANFSILIAQAAAACTHGVQYAWVDFIKEKELDRHFSVTEA